MKIILLANKAVTTDISKLEERVIMVEGQNEQLEVRITDNEKEMAEQKDTIKVLKDVISNQQSWLETLQRDKLARNVMITGIPNDDITIDNTT